MWHYPQVWVDTIQRKQSTDCCPPEKETLCYKQQCWRAEPQPCPDLTVIQRGSVQLIKHHESHFRREIKETITDEWLTLYLHQSTSFPFCP